MKTIRLFKQNQAVIVTKGIHAGYIARIASDTGGKLVSVTISGSPQFCINRRKLEPLNNEAENKMNTDALERHLASTLVELARLQKELTEAMEIKPNPRRWKPKLRDEYLSLNSSGVAEFCEWRNSQADKSRYRLNNVHKSHGIAERTLEDNAKRIEILDRICELNNGREAYTVNRAYYIQCLLLNNDHIDLSIHASMKDQMFTLHPAKYLISKCRADKLMLEFTPQELALVYM